MTKIKEADLKKEVRHQCLSITCGYTWTAKQQQSSCPACNSIKVNISTVNESIVEMLKRIDD